MSGRASSPSTCKARPRPLHVRQSSAYQVAHNLESQVAVRHGAAVAQLGWEERPRSSIMTRGGPPTAARRGRALNGWSRTSASGSGRSRPGRGVAVRPQQSAYVAAAHRGLPGGGHAPGSTRTRSTRRGTATTTGFCWAWKGSLNEYELDLRHRSVEARHEKARRGAVVGPRRVRQTFDQRIEKDFDQACRRPSGWSQVRGARDGATLLVPGEDSSRAAAGPTPHAWKRPSYATVYRILTHPAYGGVSVAGKTEPATRYTCGTPRKAVCVGRKPWGGDWPR